MPIYTLYLHTPEHEVPSLRLVECLDDEDAQRVAIQELGLSRNARSVEVTRGEHAVCVLHRSAKAKHAGSDT